MHRSWYYSRNYTLAITELFRLLSLQRIGAGDSRGPAVFRTGPAGNALVDEPSMHGAGNARDGLGRRNAGIAREILVVAEWGRSHSRYGLHRSAMRAAGGTRTRDELFQ